MKMRINFFVFIRLVLGAVFLVSGTEKLLSPVENFIYALQSYELIYNTELQEVIALTFPWVELFVGTFLLLGLWTRLALIGSGSMASGFIVFVGQAITRKLPLVDCGCFGDLLHIPIWGTFLMDWSILLVSVLLYIKIDRAERFSLDRLLD